MRLFGVFPSRPRARQARPVTFPEPFDDAHFAKRSLREAVMSAASLARRVPFGSPLRAGRLIAMTSRNGHAGSTFEPGLSVTFSRRGR